METQAAEVECEVSLWTGLAKYMGGTAPGVSSRVTCAVPGDRHQEGEDELAVQRTQVQLGGGTAF